MVQARIFLEKLSMMAWMYALVPSSNLRTETSMCQVSFGAEAGMPTVGLAGWTRKRGRRQPRSRMSRAQVVAEAKTLPTRWA